MSFHESMLHPSASLVFLQVVPGNALVVDPKKQFRPLSKFGNAFLNRFQCSQAKSEVLRSISIVDTPGILSGVC